MLYDVKKSQLVAYGCTEYGHVIRLYKFVNGDFFALYSMEGYRNVAEPLTYAEAKEFYRRLTPQMDFHDAFGY